MLPLFKGNGMRREKKMENKGKVLNMRRVGYDGLDFERQSS